MSLPWTLGGTTLGILGGGQLGRMTALAAAPLGVRTHVFCPSWEPACEVASTHTLAAYDDTEALAAFAAAVDVVTYEFENVPAATAAFLAERVPVRPGPRALAVCQHRVLEKTFLADEVGVPTAPFRAANTAEEVAAAVAELGTPCVLKTARFGYDGKGQARIDHPSQVAEAWVQATKGAAEREAIVEGFVDFELEASVVAARGVDGQVAAFPLVENRHEHHVLRTTICPAPVGDAVRAKAADIAARVLAALDYVGVIGIEMFITASGEVLVNELAPRPHNSGHWTQDGAVTSQFEQVVRACLELPLGSAEALGPAEMRNLLGDEVHALAEVLADPEAHVHLYGKTEARPGRKMGHVNWLRRG